MQSRGKNVVWGVILLLMTALRFSPSAACGDSPDQVAAKAKSAPESTLATGVEQPKLGDARLDDTKPDAAKTATGKCAVTDLDDVAEPLIPKRGRSEADEDRLQATALFAAARTNEQRQEFSLALRQYERALRCDTSAQAALSEIVALAFNLDRRAEAARYAQQIVPRSVEDATMLRRLGIELAEEGDWSAALKLYEKVAALQPAEKPSANTVLWWMETGRLYYLTKQYTAAAKQFAHVDEALERPADFGLNETLRKAVLGSGDMTYQLFGECFLDAGETAAARKAFEKSNSLKDNPPLLTYNLARVAAKDKQPEVVLEKLDEYFKSHRSEEGTGPYQLLAAALDDLGRKDELIARLEKLRADNADNTPLTFFLAEQFRQAGQLDKAEALYRKLCEPQTRRPPIDAYQALVTLLHEQKRWDDLFTLLGDALAKTGGFDPLGGPGKKLLADDAAVQSLLEVAKKQKQAGAADDSQGRWLTAALLAMECKQYADANDYFERAVKAGTKKTAELTLTWGLELLAASQFEDSIKVFRRGIDEHVLPAENPAFHFYLAGALAMAGDTDEALAEAHKAADLQPDSARFQSRVGWILYHAKKNDEARKVYEDFVKRFDGNHESADTRDVLHDARLVLSNIEVAEGHMDQAEEWIEQVLDEYPADVGALNDLGYLWADENKHLERALRMVQEAVAAEPKNMAYRDSLGWAYYRLHRFPEAVTELKIATAVEKPDGVVLDHLGDALFAQGDAAGAVASWTKAAAAFGKENDKQKSKQTQDKIDRAGDKPS
jgi:tetratricopeptide (TPR) repeat protein